MQISRKERQTDIALVDRACSKTGCFVTGSGSFSATNLRFAACKTTILKEAVPKLKFWNGFYFNSLFVWTGNPKRRETKIEKMKITWKQFMRMSLKMSDNLIEMFVKLGIDHDTAIEIIGMDSAPFNDLIEDIIKQFNKKGLNIEYEMCSPNEDWRLDPDED